MSVNIGIIASAYRRTVTPPVVNPTISGGSRSFIVPQTLVLENLNVGSTDGAGAVTGVLWEQISGPAAAIVNPQSNVTAVSAMTAGTYVFKLTINTATSTSSTTATITASNPTGTKYYVDSVSGSDSNNGTSPSTPWQTITKVNNNMSGMSDGSIIHFKRGGTYNDATLVMGKSGTATQSMIFTAYGSGAKPIISSLTTISSWSTAGMPANVYESTSTVNSASDLNMVVINNNNTPAGRMPKNGYWNIDSTDGLSVTSSSIVTNWTGGQIVLKKSRQIMDKFVISSRVGTTLNFANAGENISAGWGFFIQNHTSTLSQVNDWAYVGNKLRVYSTTTPSGVRVPSRENLVDLNGKEFIIFDNINFQGCNGDAFDVTQTGAEANIIISQCDFKYIGKSAIFGYPTLNQLSVVACSFDSCNNNAINVDQSTNTYITLSTFNQIGHYAGMGGNNTDSYCGIVAYGDKTDVNYNIVTNVGFMGIKWDGNASRVRSNVVNTTNYIKDDGGGIYLNTTLNGPIYQRFTTRYVTNNVVLNTVGTLIGNGDGDSNAVTFGIHNNGASPDVNYFDNTIHTARYGLFINNGHDLNITGNTVYNCSRNLHFLKYNSVPISGITLTRNTSVAVSGGSDSIGQYAAYFEPGNTSMPSDFVSNNNIFARPYDETNGWIWYDFGGSGDTNRYVSLNGWKTASGKDANSISSPITVDSVSKIRVEINTAFTPYNVSLGTSTYKDMSGNTKTGSITLRPLSSNIYLDTTTTTIPTANYYMAPNGSDSNSGTINSPFRTVEKLFSMLSPGQLGYVRGGLYNTTKSASASIHFSLENKSGTAGNLIKIHAYPGETPIFSMSAITPTNTDPTAMMIRNTNYLHLKGIRVTGLKQHTGGNGISRGIQLENASNNILEIIELDNIGGYGFIFDNGANNNYILNCDAHHMDDRYSNPDPYGGSNGFQATGGSTASGNTFEGCRAWLISDDGFDFYKTDGIATFKNCWAFWNGYMPGFTIAGDGCGFKLGPAAAYPSASSTAVHTTPRKVLINCMAFENRQIGFNQNNGDMGYTVYNCTAYKNGDSSNGYGFMWDFITPKPTCDFKNNVAYQNKYARRGSETDGTTNSWNFGFTINDSDFLSVSSVGVDGPRQADGSLPYLNYLRPSAGSRLRNVATNISGTTDIGAYQYI